MKSKISITIEHDGEYCGKCYMSVMGCCLCPAFGSGRWLEFDREPRKWYRLKECIESAEEVEE